MTNQRLYFSFTKYFTLHNKHLWKVWAFHMQVRRRKQKNSLSSRIRNQHFSNFFLMNMMMSPLVSQISHHWCAERNSLFFQCPLFVHHTSLIRWKNAIKWHIHILVDNYNLAIFRAEEAGKVYALWGNVGCPDMEPATKILPWPKKKVSVVFQGPSSHCFSTWLMTGRVLGRRKKKDYTTKILE